MDLGLREKIALVAAASGGLGRACALSLAREGATVVICSRSKARIERAARELREETGAEVHGMVADVSRAQAISALIGAVKRKFSAVHILVNNAGGPPTGDLLSLTESAWKKSIDLTLLSTVRLSRAVLPMMIRQRWGRIVTICSITAKQPIDSLLLSSVLRPGILGLTKVLSNTHARDGITVNSVLPGFVLTKRQEELMGARRGTLSIDAYMATAASAIPARRFGTPGEIGDVVAFLASERASYINGANILVDGGMAKGLH